MSSIPSSAVGNLIVHKARQAIPGIGDEVLEAVLAFEKVTKEHEATVSPRVWAYVVTCYAVQLKGLIK